MRSAKELLNPKVDRVDMRDFLFPQLVSSPSIFEAICSSGSITSSHRNHQPLRTEELRNGSLLHLNTPRESLKLLRPFDLITQKKSLDCLTGLLNFFTESNMAREESSGSVPSHG